jgi:hypothetical protein
LRFHPSESLPALFTGNSIDILGRNPLIFGTMSGFAVAWIAGNQPFFI